MGGSAGDISFTAALVADSKLWSRRADGEVTPAWPNQGMAPSGLTHLICHLVLLVTSRATSNHVDVYSRVKLLACEVRELP